MSSQRSIPVSNLPIFCSCPFFGLEVYFHGGHTNRHSVKLLAVCRTNIAIMSVCGVNIYAVTEWSETYDELRGFFSYIDQQIKDNREIEIQGTKYTIDVYFCSEFG